ncbi:concanavalin A-like lectin/glucanase domain-containing protein [Xylariales sp. AK1849]|nr:concanavalin A-like lectin/glucanase domain-containing protein [Xylariales sp. AK1849]
MPTRELYGLLATLGLAAQIAHGQLTSDCNPHITENCPHKKGWPGENHYVDFTKATSLPANWIMADGKAVTFNSKGAEFGFQHKGDSPMLWTDFYILAGRYDVEMQIAPGVGIISDIVAWSDDLDEIDWEFSGNAFGRVPFPQLDGMHTVQTNIFGQSQSWDGAATYEPWAHDPTEEFHTYSVEWDSDFIKWFVDGEMKREVHANQIPSYSKMPQSPMKLQMGVWDGGDPDASYWTQQWAGGITDVNGGPYTAWIKSVNITNKYPACFYKYGDKSGMRDSIQIIEDGCADPGTSTSTQATTSTKNVRDGAYYGVEGAASAPTGDATFAATYSLSSPALSAGTTSASSPETSASSPVSTNGATSSSSLETSVLTSAEISVPTSASTYTRTSPGTSSMSLSMESQSSSNAAPTSSPTPTGGLLSSLSSLILGTSSSQCQQHTALAARSRHQPSPPSTPPISIPSRRVRRR